MNSKWSLFSIGSKSMTHDANKEHIVKLFSLQFSSNNLATNGQFIFNSSFAGSDLLTHFAISAECSLKITSEKLTFA